MINTNSFSKFEADQHREIFSNARSVDWTEPNLIITRLRLVSDDGHPQWDVSYCHGYINHSIKTSEPVVVALPFRELPKFNFKRAIINHAKADNVYAKGLWLLDYKNYSLLC